MKLFFEQFLLLTLLFTYAFNIVPAQSVSNQDIAKMVEQYKKDERGPYKAIRWFCPDGTSRPAMDPCPEKGGVQRAQYKDEVVALQKSNKIYLGQILANTPYEKFWDAEDNNSRLKQYQLEKFLRASDNGWIIRKAQYYRGAVQAEDEEAWGVKFFDWLLKKDELIKEHFFLIRSSAKDIPHKGDDKKNQSVRAVSKEIAEKLPSFMNIRIKIHGLPEPDDLKAVLDFREKNKSIITPDLDKSFDILISDMKFVFRQKKLSELENFTNKLDKNSTVKGAALKFISEYSSAGGEAVLNQMFFRNCADLLYLIRTDFLSHSKTGERLALLDLSFQLEELIFNNMSKWESRNLKELIEKAYYLSKAAAGCGYLELWEWQQVHQIIQLGDVENIQLADLMNISETQKRIVEWGTAMVHAVYEDVIFLFEGFEPLAHGFTDDVVRSSLLLPLGNTIGTLTTRTAEYAQLSNKVLNIEDQDNIRGLNPGYAFGQLEIIQGNANDAVVDPQKIYVFDRPPSDLKPVAGILTVSEGNLVSHVQLLARSLGIPNAVISSANLNVLKKYDGKKVFYAVSRKGTVIMKTEDQMTETEKDLFKTKQAPTQEIFVETGKLDLRNKNIVNLDNLRAFDSGKLCGPKAANLGELKYMFPSNVVNGIVIPFGIFKEHLGQEIKGKKVTYWEFLKQIFREAAEKEATQPKEQIEKFIFDQLAVLRDDIKKIDLKKEFVNELKSKFKEQFGNEIGNVPVFIRSDTNMEDLKDFSGAGLNLTVFNVVDESKILQGIRDVWASPYTERSYKWRQKFLKNPLDVYPSILIIPSVDVEKSGVVITTGVVSGNPDEITVAFSRGAGGAVEGQKAETYIIKQNNETVLLSPSRETEYNVLLKSGGVKKDYTGFNEPLLSQSDLKNIKLYTEEIRRKFYGNKNGVQKPLDIELGIKENKIWLFQVRPFVENKRAQSSAYLLSITPDIPADKIIQLTKNLN